MTAPALSLFRDPSRPNVEMLQRIEAINASDASRSPRWRPTRLIVQNYWQFDYQEFYFVTGRAVFNGPNGTGKTSVEAAAIPVALDMEKARKRFDPQGGQQKHPSYYLLGLPDAKPDSAFYHDDRTAYIVWEFRHGGTGEYATIGIGLRAKRADGPEPPLESWGFVIPGKRVGTDLSLSTTDARGREFPLTKAELARTVGPQNVYRQNGEYQNAVNELLFGFESVDEFLYLTDTLVALRAPKVGSHLNPEKLSDQMRDALPSLSPSLMARLSTLIKRIDSAMDALTTTRTHVSHVETIHEAQGEYANQIAQQAAVAVLEQDTALNDARRRFAEADQTFREQRVAIDQLNSEVDRIDGERRDAQGAYEVQVNSEAYRTIDSRLSTQREVEGARKAEKRALIEVERANARVAKHRGSIEEVRREWFGDVAEIESEAEALEELTRSARWALAEVRVRAARGALAKAAVDVEPEANEDPIASLDTVVITTTGSERMDQCTAVVSALDHCAETQRAFEEADHRRELATEELRAADERLRMQDDVLADTRDSAATALTMWSEHAPFQLPSATLDAALDELERYTGPGVPSAVMALIGDAAREAIAKHRAKANDVGGALLVLNHKAEQARRELVTWETKAWDIPITRPGQEVARAALAAEGIPAIPLYATCDFDPSVPVSTQVRIEAALEEMGLLDALVIPTRHHDRVRKLLTIGALGRDAGDRWILEGAPLSTDRTLASVLVPATDHLAAADVRVALEQVALGTESLALSDFDTRPGIASVLDNGAWRHGVLGGQASPLPDEAPRYIGEGNRQRRREAEIKRLAQLLTGLQEEIKARTAELEQASRLQREIQDAVDDLTRNSAITALANAAADVAAAKRELERATKRLEAADRELDLTRAAARRAEAEKESAVGALDVARGLSRDQVLALRSDTQRCIDGVRVVERAMASLFRLRERAAHLRGEVDQTEREVADRVHELQEARGQIREVEGRLAMIDELLAGKDVAAIQRSVAELRKRMAALDEELGQRREKRGTLNNAIETQETLVNRLTTEVLRLEGAARQADQKFEYSLRRYAEAGMLRALTKLQASDQGPVAAAEDLLRYRRTEKQRLRDAVEERMDRIMGQLHRTFELRRMDLGAYRPELVDSWASFVGEDGQRVAADVFLQRLREIEADQARAVSEAENDLYVDFFLGDVINAIRKKVIEADEFARRINEILLGMRISNGMQFSMSWEPRTAVGATGVDYRKLIDFVRLDPDAVTIDKREAMLAEFRARVDVVRSEAMKHGEGAYGEQLHREFDYRTWFEFRFFFQKPNQPKVELKARGLEQLSVGERSLAQQLPLLAAVHARSLAMRADAPKLIAWDEALVGVDAANADELIKILVALEFSFLFTANELWGQSRHLPGCATYSMRTSGDVVFPMLSVWDGRRRFTEDDAVHAALGKARIPSTDGTGGNGVRA